MGSGALLDLATGTRRLVDAYYTVSGFDPWFSQISDDGSVLVGKMGCCRSESLTHVWVHRDGVGDLPGFPTISEVSYRFDDEGDALIVRVEATSPNGLNRLMLYSHKDGVRTAGFVPAEQSPLHDEWGQYFAAVEGETDAYERTIYLNGKKGLLDGSQFLRIVAADGKKSRVTYQDFAPLP